MRQQFVGKASFARVIPSRPLAASPLPPSLPSHRRSVSLRDICMNLHKHDRLRFYTWTGVFKRFPFSLLFFLYPPLRLLDARRFGRERSVIAEGEEEGRGESKEGKRRMGRGKETINQFVVYSCIYIYKRQIRKSVILRWPGGRFSGPGSRCDNIFILSRINFTGERRFNRNTAVTDRTNYKDRFAD